MEEEVCEWEELPGPGDDDLTTCARRQPPLWLSMTPLDRPFSTDPAMPLSSPAPICLGRLAVTRRRARSSHQGSLHMGVGQHTGRLRPPNRSSSRHLERRRVPERFRASDASNIPVHHRGSNRSRRVPQFLSRLCSWSVPSRKRGSNKLLPTMHVTCLY
jgi:hypothetical protein